MTDPAAQPREEPATEAGTTPPLDVGDLFPHVRGSLCGHVHPSYGHDSWQRMVDAIALAVGKRPHGKPGNGPGGVNEVRRQEANRIVNEAAAIAGTHPIMGVDIISIESLRAIALGEEARLAEAAAHATERPDPLTAWERSDLPRHTEDGNGGCLVCREWTGEWDEDGEFDVTIAAWPCAKVRLAATERPRTAPLDVARAMLTPLERRTVIKRGEPWDQPRCVACRFIVVDGKHQADCPVAAYLARLSPPAATQEGE